METTGTPTVAPASSRRHLARVLTPTVTLLIVVMTVAVTLRTVAYLRYYDPATAYLTDHTLHTISAWLVAVTAVLLLVCRYTVGEKRRIASFATPVTAVPSGVCGTVLLAFSLRLFTLPSSSSPQRLLAVVAALLGLGGACHFLLNALIRDRRSVLRGVGALCTVLFLAIYATYLYFDRTMPLNAPSKLTSQVAYLFSALFFLYEARISLGREKWGGYFPFALLMTLLTGYAAIPDLLLYLIRGKEAAVSLYDPLLLMALFLYALSRVTLTVLLPEDAPSPMILALRAAWAGRDREQPEAAPQTGEASPVPQTDLPPAPIDAMPEASAPVDATTTPQQDDASLPQTHPQEAPTEDKETSGL